MISLKFKLYGHLFQLQNLKLNLKNSSLTTYFLVCFHSLLTHAFFVINDSQVELGRRVVFFTDSELEMVNRLFVIFLVLKVKHSEIEIGFKIFWVNHYGPLEQTEDFSDHGRVTVGSGFETLSLAVDRINIVWVEMQNLLVEFILRVFTKLVRITNAKLNFPKIRTASACFFSLIIRSSARSKRSSIY